VTSKEWVLVFVGLVVAAAVCVRTDATVRPCGRLPRRPSVHSETGLFEPNPRHVYGHYCQIVYCCFIDEPDGCFDKDPIGLPRMVFVLSDTVAVARKCAVIYCQLLACCSGDPSGATIHATIASPVLRVATLPGFSSAAKFGQRQNRAPEARKLPAEHSNHQISHSINVQTGVPLRGKREL
jgi:hypothetical protein